MPHVFSAQKLLNRPRGGQTALTIGALGVVLGNIGTSPLYAIDQIFYGPAHVAPSPGQRRWLHLAGAYGR